MPTTHSEASTWPMLMPRVRARGSLDPPVYSGAFFRWPLCCWLGRAAASQLLPLKNEVRRKDRKRETDPHNRFVRPIAEVFPARYPSDHSPFKEHQRDSKTAGHPLPVLLDLPFQDE